MQAKTAGAHLDMVRCATEMHAVYRMFDHAGVLPYIGVTGRSRRFGEHSDKSWFLLVATITLEWHPTQEAAYWAERRVIFTEKPLYNVAGKETPPHRRKATVRRAQPKVIIQQIPAPAPAAHLAMNEIPADALGVMASLLVTGTTIREVSGALGVTRWTARRWLERLRDAGSVRVAGETKAARWVQIAPLAGSDGGDAS
jgi:hypothetical protein